MTPTLIYSTISIPRSTRVELCVLCRRNHKERRAPLHRHRGRAGSRSVGGGGREKEEEKKS